MFIILVVSVLTCVHAAGNETEKGRFAICLFGKFGSMFDKGRAKSNVDDLSLFFNSMHKHVIKPNHQVDVFAHSWEKGKEDLLASFHELYGPHLKAYRHDLPMRDYRPSKSMVTSMTESIKIMLDYVNKTEGVSYDMVVMMRYDLYFRDDMRLQPLSENPNILWLPTWCKISEFRLDKPYEYTNVKMETKRGSLFGEQHHMTIDHIFAGTPTKLATLVQVFEGLLTNRLIVWNSSPHANIVLAFHKNNWMPGRDIKQIPGFTFEVHYHIARRCNAVPVAIPARLLARDMASYPSGLENSSYLKKVEDGTLLKNASSPLSAILMQTAKKFPNYRPPLLSSLGTCQGSELYYYYIEHGRKKPSGTCVNIFET